MVIVAIDPGLHATGAAISDGQQLTWAGLVFVPAKLKGSAAWLLMATRVRECLSDRVVSAPLTRARAIVFTGDAEAMRAEAKDRVLTQAIDAGRT